jgi:hypothetical protein
VGRIFRLVVESSLMNGEAILQEYIVRLSTSQFVMTSHVRVKSLDEKNNITYTNDNNRHTTIQHTLQQYDNNIIIIISATIIGLLLIGMGIGIKFYLDKVKNKFLKQNADRFANF